MSAYDPHPWLRWGSWQTLLFEPGQGWLRWGIEDREMWEYVPDAHASHCIGHYNAAPPLRQVALLLRQWIVVPRMMLWGVRWPEDGERYRFSWEEARPCWPALTDPDRGRGIWR